MTREEKINTLKTVIEECEEEEWQSEEYQRQREETLTEIIKDLEQAPRWIPVTERLPESDEEYHTFLVTDNKGRVTLSEFYLSISDRKPYWSGMIDVLAWMPLPKAYKVESEGET